MDCPVCHYPQTCPHYRIGDRFYKTTSKEFVLNNCSNCGLLFLDEKLLSSQLENFYPSGYWWLSGGLSGRLERFYREWMVRSDQLRFTCQVLNPVIGLRLLDIGCGSGTFVKMARQAGLDAMGLEISPEALKIAR